MKQVFVGLVTKFFHVPSVRAELEGGIAASSIQMLTQQQLKSVTGGDSPTGVGVGAGDGPKANW